MRLRHVAAIDNITLKSYRNKVIDGSVISSFSTIFHEHYLAPLFDSSNIPMARRRSEFRRVNVTGMFSLQTIAVQEAENDIPCKGTASALASEWTENLDNWPTKTLHKNESVRCACT